MPPLHIDVIPRALVHTAVENLRPYNDVAWLLLRSSQPLTAADNTSNDLNTYPKVILSALLVLVCAVISGIYLSKLFDSSVTIGNTTSQVARRSMSMAWRSSGASNEALVENLAKHGLIYSPRVKQAMMGVCCTKANNSNMCNADC